MKENFGVVLITGASAGIGRELTLEFGKGAATLVLVARRLDRRLALHRRGYLNGWARLRKIRA